jgi:hypothetical protein
MDSFDIEKHEWKYHWVDMPYFYIPTRNTEERNKIDTSDIVNLSNKKTELKPKYPIYIISKGRWDNQLTARSLEKMGIDYKIVIEPLEYEKYCMYTPKDKILLLPFNNLGQGSIPARNWVWDHSLKNGDKRHWILDDNINGFGYQKGGRRINGTNGDLFRICEDFVDRYKNIAMSGIRYRFHHNYVKSPYYLNTRIYSCILIDNSVGYRWRGKYNEDTDLSIRLLKDGLCTMLFTWCYCNKAGTMSMKGGNTDTIYSETDNRREFAESLQQQHPDIVKVVWKFNRWHHEVNYSQFRNNKLLLND